MKISAAIMAHESRINRIDYLLETLGDVPVFMDYGKIGDPGNLGPWGNAKRAWKAFDPKADFHMVVQDDVVFGKQFAQRLTGLLNRHGKEPVALWYDEGRLEFVSAMINEADVVGAENGCDIAPNIGTRGK